MFVILISYLGRTPEDYLKAISQREIAWLSRYAVPRPDHSLFPVTEAQRSPDAHIALYRKFHDIADYLLPGTEEFIRSTVWHWDVHAPNIFVDGHKITSLIDWQDAWSGPLFLQARQPRLVDYNGQIMLRLPPNYEDLRDEGERSRIRAQVEKSIVLWTYENDTKETNRTLHEIYHIPQGRTRREAVKFSDNTWDGDIIPFRQCLIRIARYDTLFNPCWKVS